ncbi:hypothetical protein VNI00_006593 [Paramarasmius palmivorus]|uniref:Uncharacterized protein n=1 Tax=Paramarasmius palmivorus TaxID=297713 RepID=A0AAW0DAV3_9AGAR
MLTPFELAIPNVMLTVIGVVLGFVISYRAISGYDRYYTGRTAWSDIIKNSRVMGRLVWYHVPPCRTPRTSEEQETGRLKRSKEELSKVMAEKRMALDLIEGFIVAVKHHIRGEAGIYYEDLYDLVKPLHPESLKVHTSHFNTVTNLSRPEADLSPVLLQSSTSGLRIQHITPSTLQLKLSPRSHAEYTKQNMQKWQAVLPPKPQTHTHKLRPVLPGGNLPLEILRCLSEWLSVLEERGTVPGTSMGAIMGCVATFEDSLGVVEKIVAVPLPFVLSVHIKHTVWIYLFFLPFQLVKMFGWYSIIGVALAAFIFQGFVTAGEDLEQPFDYTPNDLSLDYFCKEIVHVEMTKLKRSPCLNAWFSRRWKERILTEGEGESRWIRKGIVVNNGTNDNTNHRPSTLTAHIGRLRSKTITETVQGKMGPSAGKEKDTDTETESDSEYDDSDATESGPEDEDGLGVHLAEASTSTMPYTR